MVLWQQSKLFTEEAVQDLELKMNVELGLNNKNQIALRMEVKMTTNGFADQLFALGKKPNHIKRSCVISSSEYEITKAFGKDLGTLRYDVNQLLDARNEIGIKVDLHFTKVANRIGGIEAHMATVLGSAQLSRGRVQLQQAKKTKASCLSEHNDD